MRFPANCFIVAYGAALLGRGTVKYTTDRRGNVHCYWVDPEGKASEFYTKGASSWPLWRRAFRFGEIRRCPSLDEINTRRDAIFLRRSMKTFKRTHDPRQIIAIVNGFPRSGKDTFVEFAGEYCAYLGWEACAISSIDLVKQITRDLGVTDEPKTPEKRALWADLKAAFEKYGFFISRHTIAKMESQMLMSARERKIGFIHVREPAAIDFMKSICTSSEFITIFVDRPDAERVQSNAADLNVADYEYDYRVDNDSTLEELKLKAQRLVSEIMARKAA